MFSEYGSYDAWGLAQLLAARKASPLELMSAAIERAREVNPAINALCFEQFEIALEIARTTKLTGSFGAIPFLLKDSIAAREFPSSMGSALFSGRTHSQDADLVTRFRAAGLIPFARTTTAPFMMSATTEASVYGGPTRNPWNLEHSSGGSSGGAAAAIAAGIVPLAHASDGGGSIRIPASCCGLFGLKPSRGRLPAGPVAGDIRVGLGTDGVLSRSVRDTALALDSVTAADLGAPYAAHGPAGNWAATLNVDPKEKYRLALWTDAFDEAPVHADCVDAVKRLGHICTKLGHHVEEAPLADIDFGALVHALKIIFGATLAVDLDRRASELKRPIRPEDIERTSWTAYEFGKGLAAADFIGALATIHSVGRRMARYMEAYDFILTPTLTRPPAKLGEITMDTDFAADGAAAFAYTSFLVITNASGQPAANIPGAWNSAGLPIGAQIIGRSGSEAKLLELAAQIERHAPWDHQRPSMQPHQSSGT